MLLSSCLDKLSSHNPDIVCLKKHCFELELALTKESKEKGLMNRSILPQNKGMLFVFEKEDIFPFWMKNTHIPLDIIWIDSEHKVVDIKSGEPLNESSIIPQGKAKYVLEINKNLADKSGIEIGDPVVFKRLD